MMSMQLPGYRVERLLRQTARTTLYAGRDPHDVAVVIKTPTQAVPSVREIARYRWAFEQAQDADRRAIVRHLELMRHGASVAMVVEEARALAVTLPIANTLNERPVLLWVRLYRNTTKLLNSCTRSGLPMLSWRGLLLSTTFCS